MTTNLKKLGGKYSCLRYRSAKYDLLSSLNMFSSKPDRFLYLGDSKIACEDPNCNHVGIYIPPETSNYKSERF